MRIKKVTAALSWKKAVILMDDAGRQWLGDGAAFYLMDERIRFNTDNTLSILDVDPKAQADWQVVDLGCMPQAGMEEKPGEIELKPIMQVSVKGDKTVLLMTEDGLLVALDQKRIQPVEGEGILNFRLRYTTDPVTGKELAPVVALYGDMFCHGIVCPKARSAADDILGLMQQIVNGMTGYVL